MNVPTPRPQIEEDFRKFREFGATPEVAAELTIAAAIDRLTKVLEASAMAAQRIATVAEGGFRVITDPLAVAGLLRQVEKIGDNLDNADAERAEEGAKDSLARALNMSDTELAS